MAKDTLERSRAVVSTLDASRQHIIDNLFGVLGNYGTTREHLEGVIEGLSNALYDAAEARAALERGEELEQRKRRPAERAEALLRMAEELIELADS